MYFKDFKGIKLSALGMGNMRLPTNGEEIDYEKGQEIIDYAYENGVNYYDTAYIYHGGKSEVFLGKALAKYPRDSFYVADKFNLWANPDYKAQFAQQCQRLNMDRIDFYLLHGLQDSNYKEFLSCGCVEYFEKLKKEGKIKHLGISTHCSPETLDKILSAHNWDFVQLQINTYDWLYESGKALYETAQNYSVPIMIMEPVRGGTLAKLTDDGTALLKQSEPESSAVSFAMRWLMRLPLVTVILSGMTTMEHITDNVKTFDSFAPLTDEKTELYEGVCEMLRKTIAVACTSCRYCCDDCPKGLDIPHLLTVYNDIKIGGNWRIGFLAGTPEDKMPAACIGCGLCSKHCPQEFDIPSYLKEMADMK